MKQVVNFSMYCILGLMLLASMGMVQQVNAKDYLDVPANVAGSLNLAVEGDTTETGERKSLDRVYRLENGGFYLLNGTVDNGSQGGFQLHIEAADPNGLPPIVIPMTDAEGNAPSPCINFVADGSLTGLYMCSLDDLGNHVRNNTRVDQDSITVYIDRCFYDYDRQAPLRMNAQDQKLYITNTIVRNTSRKHKDDSGRAVDVRENLVNTLSIENCTFFYGTGEILNDQGGALLRNYIFNHNTVVGYDQFEVGQMVNGTITNNMLVDMGWELDEVNNWTDEEIADGDTLVDSIIEIDSLQTPLYTEADRNITISNNNVFFRQELVDYVNSVDTLSFYDIHNPNHQAMIDGNPNIISKNWLNEDPEFAKDPDTKILVDWAKYARSGLPEEGFPFAFADPFLNDADDIPGTYGCVDPLYTIGGTEFHFDYPTTKQAYTYGTDGKPLGDLNWFGMTSVDNVRHIKPVDFSLAQNYPNPFNPSTMIQYSISRMSDVSLKIFNLVGQEILTLVNTKQCEGNYRVRWDGKDNQGMSVANGVYVYQLKVDDATMTRKMIMMK